MDNEQQRDFTEEQYNNRLMQDYAEVGYEHAQGGMSRYAAKRWCKVSTTLAQERDYWQGFAAGEKARA